MHFLDLFGISTTVISKCHSWSNTISIVEVSRKAGNCKALQQRQEGKKSAKSLLIIAARQNVCTI